MRILLLKSVEHLGPRGDVREVADGYARNYLIPRKLATPATAGLEAHAQRLQRTESKHRQQEHVELKRQVETLGQISCTLVRKAGDDQKLFGSVTSADVADALKTQGLAVDKRQINLQEPIKSLGVFTVLVRLSAEHKANVKVWIVSDQEKAG